MAGKSLTKACPSHLDLSWKNAAPAAFESSRQKKGYQKKAEFPLPGFSSDVAGWPGSGALTDGSP